MQSYRVNTTRVHQAALKSARRGQALFPCKPNKAPYTLQGFKDATTDLDNIDAWFERWPNALIGLPTGATFWVLDVDPKHGGDKTLVALEGEHGALPRTWTVRTPNGGLHLYFLPAEGVSCSAGKLGPGLDVRGLGGYVIAPPSPGYAVENRTPMVAAPQWLLELIRTEGHETDRSKGRTAPPVDINLAGGPIPEGQRNETLARIAGRHHDGTRDLDQLAADLLAINDKRCSPPLPEQEVRRIAASIHRRKPCKQSTPAFEPEVLEDLDRLERAIDAASWPDMGGKSARDLLIADIKLARRSGRAIPAGVRVEASVRQRALAAGMGVATVIRASKRLKALGWQRADNYDRSGTQAGALVLLSNAREVEHSSTELASSDPNMVSVPPCAPPYSAPRLRWSAPRYERVGNEYVRTTISRLGKGAGQVVDILEGSGGTLALDDLYGLVYPHKDPADRRRWRLRDFRRRSPDRVGVVARLEDAGVVEVSGDAVSLVPDWLEALNRERKLAGEIDAHRRDMARYAREREAYRRRRENPPDRAPSHEELARTEEARRARRVQLADEALRSPGSGPALNLSLCMDGALSNPEYLIRAVMHFHTIPAALYETWAPPVLEAAGALARERAPGPPPTPATDWRGHGLRCECDVCLFPEPRYAQPYRGAVG
jgi:hypothetical protein